MSWNPNNTRNDDWNRNRNRSTYLWPLIPTTEPVERNCPHCHQDILTNPKKKNGRISKIASHSAVFGFPIDEMNDTIHYCPSCRLVVGIENNETCGGNSCIAIFDDNYSPNYQYVPEYK